MFVPCNMMSSALQGYRSGISRIVADPVSQSESLQRGSGLSLAHENSPAATVHTSHPLTSRNGQTLSSEFEDVGSGDCPSASSPVQPIYCSVSCTASVKPEGAGKVNYTLEYLCHYQL